MKTHDHEIPTNHPLFKCQKFYENDEFEHFRLEHEIKPGIWINCGILVGFKGISQELNAFLELSLRYVKQCRHST